MKTQNHRSKTSGEGLVIVIVLILVVGGGLWYLVSHKQAMDKEGRAFGHEAINRIFLNYDATFLAANLSPQAKLDLPPSDQEQLFTQLKQLGVPVQPFKTEENMTWESHFFEPRGFFTTHFNYPSGSAMVQMAIDHPVGKWQIVNLTFQPPAPPQAR